MKPVVIPYQRVSTLAQAKDPEKGIARQKRRTLETAHKLSVEYGYKVIDPVTDLAKSAFHKKNWEGDAGMGLIQTWIETGAIAKGSIVVFEDFDRMSRGEPSWVLPQFLTLLRNGLRIYTNHTNTLFSQGSIDSNMGELMMTVAFICTAYIESKKKSERTLNSHDQQVKNAVKNNTPVTFGLLPAWIEISDGQYAFIEERVSLIRRMIDLCVNQNMGTQYIARLFNNEKVPLWNIRRETAKVWNSVRIHSVLTDPALYGEKTFNIASGSYTIENHYPSIIDRESFNRLNLRFRQRKESRNVNTTSSTLTNFVTGVGITECGYCGNAFVAKTIKRKTKNEVKRDRIIMCRSGQDYGKDYCTCARVLHRILERVVIEYCRDRINFQSIFNQDGIKSELLNKKDTLEIQLNEYEKKRKKLLLAFMDDDDSDPMVESMINELKVNIDETKTSINEVEDSISKTADDDVGVHFYELVEQVKVDDIPEETRKKLRLLIPQFIKKIVVYPYGKTFVRETNRATILQEYSETGCYDIQEVENFKAGMEIKDKNQLCFELFFKSGGYRYIRAHKKYGTWKTIANDGLDGFNMKTSDI